MPFFPLPACCDVFQGNLCYLLEVILREVTEQALKDQADPDVKHETEQACCSQHTVVHMRSLREGLSL